MRFKLYTISIILTLLFSNLFAISNPGEFSARRDKLMHKLNDGIIILRGAVEYTRNSDVAFKFRQSSNFYYLTGFDEPDATMILIPGAAEKFVLFVNSHNPKMAMWTGEKYGVQGAMKIFKADTAYVNDTFGEVIKSYLRNKKKIYLSFSDYKLMAQINEIIDSHWGRYPKKLEDVDKYINELRKIKSDYEIEMLQKSIDITVEAHKEAMKATKQGMFEYEIDALIKYVYLKNGSVRSGFPSIVGSGPNSTILHYEKNNKKMEKGEVVVMDIGAEYGMYSADVTRTIPVNGIFSEEQKDIYKIVLESQKAGIQMTKSGIGYNDVSNKCTEIIKDGLLKLGLITDKESRWQTRMWFMHGISHGLGLDTHDPGGYYNQTLEPGMVFTIEPGIYIAPNAFENASIMTNMGISKKSIDEFIEKVKPAYNKYKNIGIRIEDDILVTEKGYRNLSAGAPKEIKEIEEIMRKNSRYVKK